jgi:hypothetical protein
MILRDKPLISEVVLSTGVTVLLGLCNPPCQGRGEPAKSGLLYPLVWIPCCDTLREKPGSRSRVGSIASDLESWVTCYDMQDYNTSLGVDPLIESPN